jgi:hypothetical protein
MYNKALRCESIWEAGYFQDFLNKTLDRNEWSALILGHFIPRLRGAETGWTPETQKTLWRRNI